MNLQFLLDSTDYGAPQDWDVTSLKIERKKNPNRLVTLYEVPTTFTGDAYDYIVGVYDADYTAEIAIEVKYRCSKFEAFTTIIDGVIRVRDCEINRHLKLVQVEIDTDSYAAQVETNKAIKGAPSSSRSKNDVAISGLTGVGIQFFTPSTSTYGASRTSYEVYDVFTWLVDFMTDGNMSFDSEFFKSGGHWETTYGTRLMITMADQFSGGPQQRPLISFAELFEELDKRIGLGIYIDESTDTLYIEALAASIGGTDAIYNTNAALLTIRNIKHLTEYVDTTLLYGSVKIGTEETQAQAGTFQWPDVQFFNFKIEEYYMQGDYNTDAVLDLVGKFITDSNVIEDLQVNGVDDYDGTIVLFEADTGANRATDFDNINPGGNPKIYNVNLTNQEIMPRHIGGIASNATLYLGNTDDDFRAQLTSTNNSVAGVIGFTLVPYDDDSTPPNNDVNGNYDNTAGNYKYTAPADGFYSFTATVVISNFTTTGTSDSVDIDLSILRNLTTQATTSVTQTGNGTITVNAYFYMDLGDTAYVNIQTVPNGVGPFLSYSINDGIFYTDANSIGGGDWTTFDKDDARLIMYKFSKAMAFSDFQTLLADTRGRIKINCGDDTANDKNAWMEKVQYNFATGKADVILRTSRNDS